MGPLPPSLGRTGKTATKTVRNDLNRVLAVTAQSPHAYGTLLRLTTYAPSLTKESKRFLEI